MKILCICNQGENRSKTTAELLSKTGKYSVKYEGFHSDKFRPALLNWADKIIVYEEEHEELLKQYGMKYWGISLNLHIPDKYYYGQNELIKLLKAGLRNFQLL